MAKKNNKTVLIKLKSTKSGYFYVAKKNPKNTKGKMELKKYDPNIRKHVLFKETKISS